VKLDSAPQVATQMSLCIPTQHIHVPLRSLNLNYIHWLKNWYPEKEIGYSGHEYGLVTTFATIPMGVTWIERHITLDRNMWGSDHSASIEPSGLFKIG